MLEHERIREETSCGCRYDVTGLYVFLCAIHDGLNARQSGAATAVLQRYAADVEARP